MEDEVLIVDGYNLIHKHNKIKNIYKDNCEYGRYKLVELLSDYAGYSKKVIIVVFDAYRTSRENRTMKTFSNVNVVFTKKDETADSYIERFVSSGIENTSNITVVTDDNLISVLATGRGCHHLSANMFIQNMKMTANKNKSIIRNDDFKNRNTLESCIDEATRKILEQSRRN